jgi:hypothetical protein
MQTVNFFFLPINNAAELEKSIPVIAEIFKSIIDNSDNLLATPGFYSTDIWNTLYNSCENSETKLLIQLFGKLKETTISIEDIKSSDYHNHLVGISEAKHIHGDKVVCSLDELIDYYQNSAYQLLDFSELYDWKRKCFPKLLFTEDSFGSNHKAFGNCPKTIFDKLYTQTVCCLLLLNNMEMDLIKLNINERIKTIQVKMPDGTECTGKGSKEDKGFKKHVFSKSEKNGEEALIECDISCATHFKLIQLNSDYRIYFSWENEKIHPTSFIIAKVGGHWDEHKDCSRSQIVNT